MILRKEVWHSVYVNYSDYLYEIFMLEKRDVTPPLLRHRIHNQGPNHFRFHPWLPSTLPATHNGNINAILIHGTCWRQLTVLTHISSILSIWCSNKQGTLRSWCPSSWHQRPIRLMSLGLRAGQMLMEGVDHHLGPFGWHIDGRFWQRRSRQSP